MKAPGQTGTGRSPGEAAAATSSAAVHRSKTARWTIVMLPEPCLQPLRVALAAAPPVLLWEEQALQRARSSKCEVDVQDRLQGS